MAQLPKTLQGFSVFVDGQGYAGRIVRGTPPRLVKTVVRHRSGMPGPVALFNGYDAMELEFVLREYNGEIASHMLATDMTGLGSLQVRMVGAQISPDGPLGAVGNQIVGGLGFNPVSTIGGRVLGQLPGPLGGAIGGAVAGFFGSGPVEAVEWQCGGQLLETDFGQIDANDPDAEMRVRMACSRVRLTIGGGTPVWDIDFPQGLLTIGGVNHWQDVKAILEG